MTLSVRQLQFEFLYRPLFIKPVDFTLVPQRPLQMIGANGSGKSTLLKLLTGTLAPSGGSIIWNNQPISLKRHLYQQQVHYLGHKNGLKLYLTVYENLIFMCALQLVRQNVPHLMQMIQMLGLERQTHLQARYLSAGQLRRLSLAPLLLTKRPIWLLDEPTTALDEEGQQLLIDLCKAHLREQGTLAIATHQPLPLPSSTLFNLNTLQFQKPSTPPTEGPAISHNVVDKEVSLTQIGKASCTLIAAEIKATFRRAFSWLSPLLFFLIVVCLFAIAVGPSPVLLKNIAPGVLWIAALLAALISIDQFFYQDQQEGLLALLPMAGLPLTAWGLVKMASHWLVHCLPLILIGPLLGFLLDLSPKQEGALIIALLLGTPIFSLVGAIGAALVTGIRSHGLLLPILILPFYVPVLVFGVGTLSAAAIPNGPVGGHFALLGALLLVTLIFAPILTAAALRIGASE